MDILRLLLKWMGEVRGWSDGFGQTHHVSVGQLCQSLWAPVLLCQTEIFLHHHIKPLEAQQGCVAGSRHGDVSADSSSVAAVGGF